MKILKKIKDWAKRHTFHFIITIFLVALTSTVVVQYGIVLKLKKDLNETNDKIVKTEKDIKDFVIKKNKMLQTVVKNNYDSTNARIDNLDTTVQYDDKRRMLVTEIRKAIIGNTNATLTMRDLNKIANAIIDYSYEWKLTIPQVLAQIKVESNFNPKALSKAGAQGLMQIMPRTFRYIHYELPDAPINMDAWNIHHNIRAGCFYMAQQRTYFGSYEEALRAYNWGPDSLEKYNAGEIDKDKMPEETREYVPKVLRYIEVFKKYGLDSL